METAKVMGRREFIWLATKLAIPIMIQNLISTLVNMSDTVMLGYVSQTAMSASSLANNFTFVLFCLYFGMSAATSVLCAQYWGKGDKTTVEKIVGLAFKLSVVTSALFFAVSFFGARYVMYIFSDNPETIELGIKYLRVVSTRILPMTGSLSIHGTSGKPCVSCTRKKGLIQRSCKYWTSIMPK